MPCRELNRKNEPCNAPPLEGTDLCAMHADAGLAKRLGSAGGQRNRHFEPVDPVDIPKLDTAQDVKAFLAQVAIDLRFRRIEPKAASTIGYVCTSLLKAIELSDLEARLAKLEGGTEDESEGASGEAGEAASNHSGTEL